MPGIIVRVVVGLVLICAVAVSQIPARLVNLGPGCDPATDPILNASLPVEGQPIAVTVDGAASNAQGLLFASAFGATPLQLLGCTFYVDLADAASVPFTTNASGSWTTALAPAPVQAIGFQFNLQAVVVDGSLALSNGLEGTIGDRAARLRVLHASPDAPEVDVLVNGGAVLQSVDYREASGFIPLNPGSYTVQVDGLLPGGPVPVIGPATATLSEGFDYTVIASDVVSAIAPLVVTRPTTSVPAFSTRVAVVHGAPSAPAVDVYVTAPSASLSGAAPLGSFSFQGQLGPVVVPNGDYRIRVTGAGSSTVVFDSGTITLPDNGDLLIVAVDNTTTGASPISLVVMGDAGAFEIFDASTPANVRVVHASPDAPAVDVIVNDDFANPLVGNLAFPNFTGFVGVAPDTYNIKVVPTGTTTAVIDATLPLAQATETTVIAVDTVANIQPLVVTDDRRAVGTYAKLRVIHGSPTAGSVDVYLTGVGAGIAGATPALSGVPFFAVSDYLAVPQGSYDIVVTPAGSSTAAIGPLTVSLVNGGVYTAIARDASGGGTPLDLIALDDL